MWSTYSRVPFIFLSLWSTYSIIPFFSFYPCYLFSNAAALFGSSALCGSIWHLLTKTLNVIPSFYLHLFRDTSWSFKRFFGTCAPCYGGGPRQNILYLTANASIPSTPANQILPLEAISCCHGTLSQKKRSQQTYQLCMMRYSSSPEFEIY